MSTPSPASLQAIFAPLLPESLAGACQTAEKGATAAAPIAMCGKAVVHVISDDDEEEASKAHDKERAVLEADMEQVGKCQALSVVMP